MRLEEANKPESGWISRHINAPLSLRLSRRLVNTRVKPNHVTLVSLLVGLLAAFLISRSKSYPCVAAAGVLWQFFAVLDHTDGVLARVKNLGSPRGAWFDTITGHVTYVAFLGGVTVGMVRLTGENVYGWIGLSTLGFTILSLVPSYLWMRRSGMPSLETYNDTLKSRIPGWIKYLAKGQFSRLLFCFLALLNQMAVIYGLANFGAWAIGLGLLMTVGKRLRNLRDAKA